jgi:hypothetical protein
VIDMIRIIASDYRLKPRLIAECTVCGWRDKYGERMALATIIARAQDHVTSQHHDALPLTGEVGLPGVTDRVVLEAPGLAALTDREYALIEQMRRDYEIKLASHAQASDLHKYEEQDEMMRAIESGADPADFFRPDDR